MYLVVGDSQDPWCIDVSSTLKANKKRVELIPNPLSSPTHFSWRLSNEQSTSKVLLNRKKQIQDYQIKGVFIRRAANIDSNDWEPDDYIYMQTEIQAALLAWLWSLKCQVVNRYPASIWYRPRVPLIFWQRLLRRSGLPALETLITNVQKEAQSLKSYVVYGPLTSDIRFLINDNQEWCGLSSLQRLTPVCLTPPHEEATFVCIVGRKIFWERKISSELNELEPALLRFSELVGLRFLELALAKTAKGLRVIAVEPYPFYEHFEETVRQKIVSEIVRLLSKEKYFENEVVQLSLRTCL